MTHTECIREEEVLELLRAGRWPSGCDDELRAHVAACALCADLAAVAAAVAHDREAILLGAEIPGSGIVWWRMQMRMRQETARAAGRTLTAVQALIVVLAGVIAFAILNFTTPGWLKSVAGAFSMDSPLVAGVTAFAALILLAAITLAPVAAYLAMSKE